MYKKKGLLFCLQYFLQIFFLPCCQQILPHESPLPHESFDNSQEIEEVKSLSKNNQFTPLLLHFTFIIISPTLLYMCIRIWRTRFVCALQVSLKGISFDFKCDCSRASTLLQRLPVLGHGVSFFWWVPASSS